MKQAKAVVYYRDLPSILLSHIAADGEMAYTKDGVQSGIGHKCPRITVLMKPISPAKDKLRTEALERLLTELLSNNQIVDFKMAH